MSTTRKQNERAKQQNKSEWVNFSTDSDDVSTDGEVTINRPLLERGIITIAYNSSDLETFANPNKVTIGHRILSMHRSIDYLNIYFIKDESEISSISNELIQIPDIDAAYIIGPQNIFFLKKESNKQPHISQPIKIEIKPPHTFEEIKEEILSKSKALLDKATNYSLLHKTHNPNTQKNPAPAREHHLNFEPKSIENCHIYSLNDESEPNNSDELLQSKLSNLSDEFLQFQNAKAAYIICPKDIFFIKKEFNEEQSNISKPIKIEIKSPHTFEGIKKKILGQYNFNSLNETKKPYLLLHANLTQNDSALKILTSAATGHRLNHNEISPTAKEEINIFNSILNEIKKPFLLLHEKLNPNDSILKILTYPITEHHLSESENPSTVKAKKLLTWFTRNNLQLPFNPKDYLANPERRGEVFIPLAIDKEKGIYVYPWLSEGSPSEPFKGVKVFVTAACLCASLLKGCDPDYLIKTPIVKHKVSLPGDAIIKTVAYEIKKFNPIHEINFWDFKNQLSFIKATLENKHDKVRIVYHLPYVDYMLFGIKLFLHGRMTLKALNDYFKILLSVKNGYEAQLRKIISQSNLENNIELDIQSPFSPLLKLINCKDIGNLAKNFLTSLQLDFNITTNEKERTSHAIDNEEKLVKFCKKYLTTHGDEKNQAIWKDLNRLIPTLSKGNVENSHSQNDPIENLFVIGNTFILAAAACGTEPNSVISMLPGSEKQIQIMYAAAQKKVKKEKEENGKQLKLDGNLDKNFEPTYPPVFMLTVLDSVITYGGVSATTKNNVGLAFYFDYPHPDELYEGLKLRLPEASRELNDFARCHLTNKWSFPNKPYSSHTSIYRQGHSIMFAKARIDKNESSKLINPLSNTTTTTTSTESSSPKTFSRT